MSYMALYRQFRPTQFKDMYGQEHITTTLKNQILNNRIGHAYLFSGGRGTGKTSSAKILARAINCLNPIDGEPCNECDVCKGIISGSVTDVVEMDAASNNGVDDIRQIREEVAFLPTVCKYRVYIIDEVHMLSTGAFNALLKTLEEPPAHVIFILATTEPQKLPLTILSRCQKFDFKRIPVEDIKECLKSIASKINLKIQQEALDMIAVLADGALRDAISILERCILDGQEEVNIQKIRDLVGIPDGIYIYNLVKSILEYNVIDALQALNDAINTGKDINAFIWQTIKYVKDILVYKKTNKLELYMEEEKAQIESLSKLCEEERLINIILTLSETQNNIKKAQMKNIILEADIIRLCQVKKAQDIEQLASKVEELEKRMQSQNSPMSFINKKEDTKPVKSSTQKKVNNINSPSPKVGSISTSTGEYLNCWNEIVSDLKDNGKIMLYTNLLNTKAKQLSDLVLGIEFQKDLTSFGKTVITKPENEQALKQAIFKAIGKEMHVKCIESLAEDNAESKNGLEILANDVDMPINIIEE